MSAYSSLKVLHHPDRLEQLKQGKQIVPTQVHLIISDLCNQNCSFCAYRMDGYTSNAMFGVIHPESGEKNNNPNRMIPYEKVVEILDDCQEMGVKAIQITGGGEPTVHPKCAEIFEDVLKRDLNLALVTNGVKIVQPMIESLAEATWIRVSIDAGNETTYSQVREVSKDTYHRVWKNVTRIVQYNRAAMSECVVGIGFVVTKENWEEVKECAHIAKETGVNNIRLSAVFQQDNEDYFKDFYEDARELCILTKDKYEDDNFKVYNNFGERLEDLKQHSPDYHFCGYQEYVTYIGGDLNVYRCCNTAYNPLGLLGSIHDKSFQTFWNSKEKKERISSFNAQSCERCMFNNKNRVINYILDEDPTHVNYV